MNISPNVKPIDTEHASPVSDAITGFILVVIGSLGICGVVWLWMTFRSAL